MKVSRFILMMALSLLPVAAMGHSRLLHTTPADGAILDQPPTALALEFNTPVESRLGKVEIDHKGWQALDAQVSGKRIEARLPALQSGNYKVRWQVLSKDGHVQRGNFVFTIR